MQLARGLEVVGGEADLVSLKCFDEACQIPPLARLAETSP